jgi:hypothetical protein
MSPDRSRQSRRRGTEVERGGPGAAYLTIGGRGEPAGSLFEAKVSARYSVVYAIKLGMGQTGRDFAIGSLEAFWTMPPGAARTWKVGIRAPAGLSPQDLAAAIATLSAKGKDPLVKDVLLEHLDEGQLECFPLEIGAGIPAPM